jgi:tetratricopeptide (TPR) repeat protein
MMLPRFALRTLTLVALSCFTVAGAQAAKPAPPAAKQAPGGKMPLTGLAPSVLVPDLCVLEYRVSTTSPECQAFFNQGLGYFYSYVYMEAARSFETAAKHDPNCALAWWGLSRALEKWGKGNPATKALLKAHELREGASHREQMLIKARMQEKGQLPGVGDSTARKQAAQRTLDDMIALYDDDEEAWYYRSQLAGDNALFGRAAAAVPFYKALLKINPLHPAANHELLHFYENIQRPALGWLYAENYLKSSPGIPHANHMQAHLATRLGRWNKTSDRSARAVELERAYHKQLHVNPKEDPQYSHHLEILTLSLIHDGRFAEGRAIEAEARKDGFRQWGTWFRLHLVEGDWDGAMKLMEEYRRSRRNDKQQPAYWKALIYLAQGKAKQALPEIEVLQQLHRNRKKDRRLEFRLWETQGLYLCQTGSADEGLKLLARTVQRSKDDYSHHAWGNGACYMESWGVAALKTNRAAAAEEAFQEALAHDPASVVGAVGMQVLCEEQGRTEEAARFAALAQRCWRKADPGRLEALRADLRGHRFGTARTETSAGH